MINVAKKTTLKLSLMSLLTLFKTCKVQVFVKLKFKLLLPKIVPPIHP
jgi:hypothetical protein